MQVLATRPPTASDVIISRTTALLRVRLMKFDATFAPFGLVGASDWAPGEHTHSRESLIHRAGLRPDRGPSYLKAAVTLSPGRVVLRPGTGSPRVRGLSRNHSLHRITTMCTAGAGEEQGHAFVDLTRPPECQPVQRRERGRPGSL